VAPYDWATCRTVSCPVNCHVTCIVTSARSPVVLLNVTQSAATSPAQSSCHAATCHTVSCHVSRLGTATCHIRVLPHVNLPQQHPTTCHPSIHAMPEHQYSAYSATCRFLELPCVTTFVDFLPIGQNLQNAINFPYSVRLSPFKLRWKVLVELYAMESFSSTFEDIEFSVKKSIWIISPHREAFGPPKVRFIYK
jgi:hypothetical protein